MSWTEPITNRTVADADRLIKLNCTGWHNMTSVEREEWLSSKGALNETDFNRVENNIKHLSDALDLGLTTYADNIPYNIGTAYVTNLTTNLTAIKNSGFVKPTTPSVPENPLKGLEWNDVEQIILDCYDEVAEKCVFYHSIDELHAGEGIGLVL